MHATAWSDLTHWYTFDTGFPPDVMEAVGKLINVLVHRCVRFHLLNFDSVELTLTFDSLCSHSCTHVFAHFLHSVPLTFPHFLTHFLTHLWLAFWCSGGKLKHFACFHAPENLASHGFDMKAIRLAHKTIVNMEGSAQGQ